MDELNALNFDLVDEYIALYRNPDTPLRTKHEILKELMSYGYIKRRPQAEAPTVNNTQLNITWAGDTPNINTLPAPTVDVTVVPDGEE